MATSCSVVRLINTIGIQIFMCLHGLSLYIETSHDLRNGRLPFIILSFAILFLSIFPALFNGWYTFDTSYSGGAGPGGKHHKYDESLLGCLVSLMAIGDCLMVCGVNIAGRV